MGKKIYNLGRFDYCWADKGKSLYYTDVKTGVMLSVSRITIPYDVSSQYYDGATAH